MYGDNGDLGGGFNMVLFASTETQWWPPMTISISSSWFKPQTKDISWEHTLQEPKAIYDGILHNGHNQTSFVWICFFNSHKGDILGYKTFNAIWVCLKLEWGISTYILLFVIVPIRIANLGFLSLFWTNSRSCWYFINELFRYGYQLIWLRIQIMLVSIWLRICIGIIHSIFRSSRFRWVSFCRLSFIIWNFSPLVQMTRTSIPEIDPASCLWMHNVIWLDHFGTSAPVGNKDQNDCPANQCSYVFIFPDYPLIN